MADIIKPDLCIVGAGAPGIALAMAARAHGAGVVLLDTGSPGDSLRAGPVPMAALSAAAAHAQALRHAAAFGMVGGEPKPNFRGVHDHVQSVIAAIAPRETPERLRALGIDLRLGPASFLDKRTLQAGDVLVRARRFVLATGSRPIVPPLANLDQVAFFTADTIWANAYKLSHLVVLGGSATALQFAQAYRRLGCDVSIIEASAALADIDPELAAIALRKLREEGVVIHERSQALEVLPRSQGIGLRIRQTDGAETTLDASHILVALGRKPDFSGLALDKAGIRFERARDDRLMLRPHLLTTNGRVHVIGEAAGGLPSLQAARHDAHRVMEYALFRRAPKPMAGAVASVVFTDPQLAQVGLSETEARQRFKSGYVVLRASFAENARAIATRRIEGSAKLITDPRGIILGIAIAGPEAGELVALFGLAIRRAIAVPDLADLALPDPSFSAIIGHLVAAWHEQAGPEHWRQRRLALVRRLP
ncbi:FAD-dependent oxidoreductase [uncultured Devosia sp.]|uniref:FAD-dependent oxidoreductase n=1 Tax=uncultured Devosia sp. TaxID=211434 RepID=UPI0035C96B08